MKFLYAKEKLHAGLIIIVPNMLPQRQCELFSAVLGELCENKQLINEAVEIWFEGDAAMVTRYILSAGE